MDKTDLSKFTHSSHKTTSRALLQAHFCLFVLEMSKNLAIGFPNSQHLKSQNLLRRGAGDDQGVGDYCWGQQEMTADNLTVMNMKNRQNN